MSSTPADTARYNRFVADLFGMMAYGELSAFERFAADARYSPTLHDRAVLGRIAVVEFRHYELVNARLETRELIEQIQASDETTEVLRDRLKGALADDPRLASRLALWGRRLLGEALTQAQRVSYEHAFLGSLIGGEDTAEAKDLVSGLIAGLAENHSKRMTQLGLTG